MKRQKIQSKMEASSFKQTFISSNHILSMAHSALNRIIKTTKDPRL